MSNRVQTVVVVGRDAPAWLTAAALRKSFGRAGVRVQVVELPRLRAPVDAYAAVPSLAALHQLLGLEESVVLGACQGAPMVAQRFSNWARGGVPYFVAYDDEPPPGSNLPFVQYWVKGALEGLRVGFEDFSLGTACARLGRVPIAPKEGDTLSASYGYHLDALAYSELAKQFALRLGVEQAASTYKNANVDSGRIVGLDLVDGTQVTGDLYVDASGAEALLIGQMPGAVRESWADCFPCDRLLAISAPPLQDLPAFSQISAFKSGWVGIYPMRHRTAILAAYNSSATTDRDVAQQVGVIARMPVSGEAVVSELRQGAQLRPWIGNCVAIGEAAIATDPIDAVDLHVTHGCISHLITSFPARADRSPEAEAYNGAIRLFGENLRDFQATHYRLNQRFDEAFWDGARDKAMPATLQRRLDTFDARTIVTLNDEESFEERAWASLFLGCGLMPKGYDPRVDGLADEMLIGKVQDRLREVARLAQQMPTVGDFLLDEREPAKLGQ